MRIHTDNEINAAPLTVDLDGVYLERWSEHRSTSKVRAYEVRLAGNGALVNSHSFHGATWDEWGTVLARIFEQAPDARMGGTLNWPGYNGRTEFHDITGLRFIDLTLPDDTHPRHRWGVVPDSMGYVACMGCSARVATGGMVGRLRLGDV